MKRFAPLLLALLLILPAHAQSRATSTITVAPYGQAVLSANGPTTWAIYQLASGIKPYTAGNDLVFSAAPGVYLVVGTNASGSSTVQVTFEAPGGGASPVPAPPNVQPTPVPAPPTPAPAPGDFIYPPTLPPAASTTGFAAAIAKAAKGSSEAKSLALLYSLVANEIELDGRLATPKLKQFNDAKAILKKETVAFLGGYLPTTQVTDIAVKEFAKTGITEGAPLTPPVRSNYVVFLRQLSQGFELAANGGDPQ